MRDWNTLLRAVAADHPDVGIVDLGARVSPGGHYSATVEGVPVRADGLHLAPEGVQSWVSYHGCSPELLSGGARE